MTTKELIHSHRTDGRGHWPTGKRRHSLDAERLLSGLVREFGPRHLARLCEVDEKTVRRWGSGSCWPTPEMIHHMIDRLFPQSAGALPIYSTEMAIDGNTRVGGVGEYTLRAAAGLPCLNEELEND